MGSGCTSRKCRLALCYFHHSNVRRDKELRVGGRYSESWGDQFEVCTFPSRQFTIMYNTLDQVRALDLGSCSSALHSKDTKGYVIPPGQPGKRDRNIENEKTNFFVGVPKLCGLNTDANPHIQNQKHCDSKSPPTFRSKRGCGVVG